MPISSEQVNDDAGDAQPTPAPRAGKLKRRWLRFSLRSMLLALTVTCLWLGVQADRAQRQKRAVEALRDAGCLIKYDYEIARNPFTRESLFENPRGHEWLRPFLGADYFDAVAEVELGRNLIDND